LKANLVKGKKQLTTIVSEDKIVPLGEWNLKFCFNIEPVNES
jgi:hypothetical protein